MKYQLPVTSRIRARAGLAKASPANIARTTLSPMVTHAGSAENVAYKPGEYFVLFLDLSKLWPVVTLTARVTDSALPVGALGTDDV
jgi:hypothetical protein